ncbi:hypothetical protein RB195_007376 [Necator americanus]|uniref:Uncharacterized protein n=1 Tax=Necator americanus TaxID=51031 RepID=A0ABR1C0S9_NECAM
MGRCGSTPALTIFVACALSILLAFYMDLEKFYREDHTFYKVIIGDFSVKIGPRRTPEETPSELRAFNGMSRERAFRSSS